MDVSSIASYASLQSQGQVREQVQLSVLKTAQDMASQGAMQLLDSVAQTAPVSTASSNPNVGNNIDVRA
ncbi:MULTISPECIES: YjfB family protein [Marinobacter]|uniref:YjfB family protein n=1 Tax=Marinobacter xestospongiae TaxID=994319 RepID=A0ABU3W057_9GAMM|nr:MULTISPECIES: YjfB family protein [Marinobacter]MCG8520300.1 YjfB family protein [Pseudomonadales bacterium]MCK7567429.1 YjfB family protein [Marinobacter xestospongiae]MDV2079577.1 YjfB family protein [Marinobacter xestospongiae]UDL04987.1 YjfB family protein [Marinobacter sp. CA1]